MSAAVTATATAPNPFSPEALAAKVLEKLGASPPTAETILRRAAELAVLVNKAPGLKGPEKMALVQRVLRDIVNMPDVRAKGLSDEAVAALNAVIDDIVPTAITLIVSAGRGEFDLKKVTPAKAWAWCCRAATAVAVAASAPKADTASIVKAAGGAAAAVVAEVTVEMAAPAPAPPADAGTASSAPIVSENPTPAPQ
jgi:hypothetical protein